MSHVLDGAVSNMMAAFVRLNPQFRRLTEINDAFRVLTESTIPEEAIPLRLFTNQSHASYLSACLLSLSGLLPGTYMVLRGCLEAALYGCHVAGNVERFKTWGDRNQSDEARQRVRQEFTTPKVMASLKAVHGETHDIAKNLYGP